MRYSNSKIYRVYLMVVMWFGAFGFNVQGNDDAIIKELSKIADRIFSLEKAALLIESPEKKLEAAELVRRLRDQLVELQDNEESWGEEEIEKKLSLEKDLRFAEHSFLKLGFVFEDNVMVRGRKNSKNASRRTASLLTEGFTSVNSLGHPAFLPY